MLVNKRIPFLYIIKTTWLKLLLAAIVGGALSFTDKYFADWFGMTMPMLELSIVAMLGTSLALILAFRMNQAYDRWWEARKVWGGIVNDTRALIRQVSHFKANNAEDEAKLKEFRDSMIKDILAWCNALKDSLRGIDPKKGVSRYLSDERLAELAKFDVNLPNAILYSMMERVKKAYAEGLINEYQQMHITGTIDGLGDSMGKCERIKGTVFPRLYSTLIEFGIWAFIILFPLAFSDPNEYFEFPIIMSFFFVFIVLEQLAINLQDPFENEPTDVPITAIVTNIEIFGLKILEEDDIPEKTKPQKFYLM